MSGKRHHHIWKHIQNGFATKEFGDFHTWVYRKEGPAKRTVTRLHGYEKYFYGEEGSLADTNLTRVEGELNEFVTQIRKLSAGTFVDFRMAGLLTSSIEVRSAFIRSECSKLLERVIYELKAKFQSPKGVEQVVRSYLSRNPDEFSDAAIKAGFSKEAAGAILEFGLPSIVKMIGEPKLSGRPSVDALLSHALSSAAAISRAGHIKSLESEFINTPRIAGHQAMRFVIQKAVGADLVLPDSGVAFLLKDRVRPLSQKGDKIEQVLIPVSSETLLVGFARDYVERSPETIRSILVSCAFDSFIGKDNNQESARLVRKIGENALLLKDDEIAKIVRTSDFGSS